MKGRASLFLALVLSMSLLTGCWDFKEVEHVIYLNALGVDYVNGKYILYAQVIDFSNLSKQEIGGGRHPEKAAIGKGIGDTFDQAAFDLYRTEQGQISWAYISGLVFSERAIKSNIPMQAIDLMRRFHEMRHTIWTFGTKESLDQLFSSTPIMNLSILYSRLTSPEEPFRQSSEIQPLYLNQVISTINESAETTLLPFLSISKTRWKMGEEPHPSMQVKGVGVILNGKYQGFVDQKDLQGVRWTSPQYRRSAIFTHRKGKPFAAVVIRKRKCIYKPILDGDKVAFDLEINVQGMMLEVCQKISEDTIRQAVVEQMEREIRESYEVGLDQKSDILNLGLQLYRQNPQAWHRLSHNAALPLSKKSLRNIRINVKIQSSGKLKL